MRAPRPLVPRAGFRTKCSRRPAGCSAPADDASQSGQLQIICITRRSAALASEHQISRQDRDAARQAGR